MGHSDGSLHNPPRLGSRLHHLPPRLPLPVAEADSPNGTQYHVVCGV